MFCQINFSLPIWLPSYHCLEPPPTIHIKCLPGGKAELSCETDDLSSDLYWTLNGSLLNDSEICVKHGGRKIVLEKIVRGKLTCQKKNSASNFSTELLCDDGKSCTLSLPLSVDFMEVFSLGFSL